MNAWLELGLGPLFRLSLALALLGLARVVLLAVAGILEAYRRNPDKIVAWPEVRRQAIGWTFPATRLLRRRPVYSVVSVLFHVGLLGVPLLLAAHGLLWKRAVGWAWPAVPQRLADVATVATVAAAFLLVAMRYSDPAARSMSRASSYLWPLLLAVPFATGFLSANAPLSPAAYQAAMAAHVLSADLILALLPFSKLAHCILAPFSQVVTAVAWKFPAGAGDRVSETLGYAEPKSWIKGARRAAPAPGAEAPGVETGSR